MLPMSSRYGFTGPPDVSNAALTATGEDFFTVSWERHEGSFDYYWMVVKDSDSALDGSENQRVGSCASGALLRPQQTHITCHHVKSCTNASLTIYTHVNGPPERTSQGVTVHGIFIQGKDLHPPKNVTFTGQSPSLTRLQWISSSSTQGTTDAYTVKICDAFQVCNSTDGVQKCVHQETPLPWLEFVTTPDTEYCVLVASTALCGQDTI
ncbi:hypothetical protein V5799_004753 [Amblyomma americanum]|uniref:Uncharacterized protein n=1 Tax=Amblyomma americanum TaxID=6943 RepID=A0AAQ4D575_AMBAM